MGLNVKADECARRRVFMRDKLFAKLLAQKVGSEPMLW
jgi:hypothetical protein